MYCLSVVIRKEAHFITQARKAHCLSGGMNSILSVDLQQKQHSNAVLRRNFWDKLISLKKLLNIWSQRDISVYGKTNLLKSLALSKLVFIGSEMETPI